MIRSAAPGMLAERGLRRKMWVAFAMQVIAIGLATVFGVYGATMVLKDVLIKHALQQEAEWFWWIDEIAAAAIETGWQLMKARRFLFGWNQIVVLERRGS